MEGIAFLGALKELTAAEDVLAVGREVNELSTKFEDYMLEEERKLQVAQLEAQERGEEAPENPSLFQLKSDFHEELKAYKAKKRELLQAVQAAEEANLSRKRALMKRLQEVIQNEENIGKAFHELKEIQETWKTIGDIPRDKRNDIQHDYSKLIEDFFYNIKIYKDLQAHDLHRNEQLKEQVVEQLKALDKEENIKEVEHHLKALQHDWEDIGPVPNEKWEALKEEYWKAVRHAYDRINAFYEERRHELQENLEKKQALLEQTSAVVVQAKDAHGQKDWEHLTEQILGLQATWKTIGFGPKKENEEIWKAFRAACDEFFDAKKTFYAELQHDFDEVAEKKKTLIEKAQALQESTDWKKTANQLKQLQQQWKGLGNAGQRHEQKLWKQFRAACDVFFDNRQKHFESQDKEFESNLAAKEALIKEIESFEMPEEKHLGIEVLKSYAQRFAEIGHVPMKVKDKVYNAYKAALDKHYDALKLEGEEKHRVMFQAKLDTMAASPDSGRMFAREKAELRKRIDQLKGDIIQFENNLGFFANSKGADALKRDVERKVERAKEEIESIKHQIKLIPNE